MLIQAQYATLEGSFDLYSVVISLSKDGITSQSYYYDPLTMQFDSETNTLTMPKQSISIQFTRNYDSKNRSLVNISGTIDNINIKGYTPFNPVPLSAFGGAPMTNNNGDKLVIDDNNIVIYNGEVIDKVIYVPLMYILAYPVEKPTTEMSLGTAGLKGTACIVMSSSSGTQKTSFIYAIPDAN